MLHQFLAAHRTELIGRCRSKVAQRPAPAATDAELAHGIPLFLDQINRYLAAISAVLGYAVKRGHMKTKPSVPKRREAGKRLLWATHEQAEKLIRALPNHLVPLVRFSLATGVREHNGTHLEWSQIDTDRRVAWIEADQAKAGKLRAAIE